MAVAFADHRRAIREGREGTFFTPHAADNEAEFFADATEAFYCRPHDLKALHPEMYGLLAAYYRVDPERVVFGGLGVGVEKIGFRCEPEASRFKKPVPGFSLGFVTWVLGVSPRGPSFHSRTRSPITSPPPPCRPSR